MLSAAVPIPHTRWRHRPIHSFIFQSLSTIGNAIDKQTKVEGRSQIQKVGRTKELEKKLVTAKNTKETLEFKYEDHLKENKDEIGIHQCRLYGKEEAFKQCGKKIRELMEEGNCWCI